MIRSCPTRRPVTRLTDEVSLQQPSLQNGLDLLEYEPDDVKPKRKPDRRLYEVEVAEVDHEKKKMRIHFKGYSTAIVMMSGKITQTLALFQRIFPS